MILFKIIIIFKIALSHKKYSWLDYLLAKKLSIKQEKYICFLHIQKQWKMWVLVNSTGKSIMVG